MKKILVCAAFFYPHVGGYENYIYEIYSRMTDEFHIDILVSDFQKNIKFEEYNDLHIHRLESWCLLGEMYPIPKITNNNLKILKKLMDNEYIFINTHTRFFILSFIGFSLSKLKGTKLIHTEHGTGQVISNKFYLKIFSSFYDKLIGRAIFRGSHVNIGISKASCDFLRKNRANNICLISNGVDTDHFIKKSTNLKEKLGINDEYIVITFVGRLIYSKGVQDLIRSFLDIKKLGILAKLIIVGDGSYRDILEDLSKGDNDIIFLGIQNNVSEVLSITDIFVNPSYSEGLPTTILEAASVGIPIIATDVGGTREILINGMGCLIEPRDIKALSKNIIQIIKLNDDQLELKIIQKFIKDNYSWNGIIENFLKVIK